MDLRSALAAIAAAVAQRRLILSYHGAVEKMDPMGLTRDDVHHALSHANDGIPQTNDGAKWKVYGPVLLGERLAVVVRFLPD